MKLFSQSFNQLTCQLQIKQNQFHAPWLFDCNRKKLIFFCGAEEHEHIALYILYVCFVSNIYPKKCRPLIGSNVPSQNTLILLNKNLKIYESFLRRWVHQGSSPPPCSCHWPWSLTLKPPKEGEALSLAACSLIVLIPQHFFLSIFLHISCW